jgi:hypothetical protein
VQLSLAIAGVDRDQDVEDVFSWPCDISGRCSAKSTYLRLCGGGIRFAAADCIWKPWAPAKCKIFQWLAVQYRMWTTDRRAKHGLQDTANVCFSCLQDIDSLDHILLHCSYAREVWFYSFREANLEDVTPTVDDRLEEWWLSARARFRDSERRDFDARVMLICWSLLKQRNARALNNINQQCSATQLVSRIKDEFRL